MAYPVRLGLEARTMVGVYLFRLATERQGGEPFHWRFESD